MPDVSSSMTGHTSSRLSSTGQEHSNTVTQIVRQNVIGGAASVLDRIESGRWECVVRVHLFVGALDNGLGGHPKPAISRHRKTGH